MKKTIALITKGSETLESLLAQLKEYVEPFAEVVGYAIDNNNNIPKLKDVDQVILASKEQEIYRIARRYVSKHIPIQVVRRMFEPHRIKGLMQIKEGTKVLVINNMKGTCQEVIESLHEARMDHLHYTPYYPGCMVKANDYPYALTMRTPEKMPPSSVQLLDIGIRKIHVYDLMNLGRKFQVPEQRIQAMLDQFIEEVYCLGQKLGVSFSRVQSLHSQLEATFQAIQEPLISIDEKQCITFINKVALELFGVTEQETVGESIYTLDNPFFKQLMYVGKTEEQIIQMKGQHFIVTTHPIQFSSYSLGTIVVLKNITEIQTLERRLRSILKDKGFVASYSFQDIVGESRVLTETIEKAKRMAKVDRTVLIRGENGTGKELFAHAMHISSHRCNGPFVAINCASLPENLLESEIFGYEEGAFTGAKKGGKPGVFEQADGGTIFLDEIGDISPAIQVRLLRVLQEKQVVRIGGSKVLSTDVRVITATNQDLEEAVQTGRFREDLYFRLNVLPIEVPPLRERNEDIELLVSHYMAKMGEQKEIDRQVIHFFQQYSWPGNIRELINVLEYAVTISEHQLITLQDLPERLTKEQPVVENKVRLGLEELKILYSLYQFTMSGEPVGRYTLISIPELRELGLTEQRLRTKLKQLAKKKLVIIGKTRQGTRIAEDGIRVLKEHMYF